MRAKLQDRAFAELLIDCEELKYETLRRMVADAIGSWELVLSPSYFRCCPDSSADRALPPCPRALPSRVRRRIGADHRAGWARDAGHATAAYIPSRSVDEGSRATGPQACMRGRGEP
jgi:hypothetical protein